MNTPPVSPPISPLTPPQSPPGSPLTRQPSSRPSLTRALSEPGAPTEAYVQRPPMWGPGYTHTLEWHMGQRTHVYRRNPLLPEKLERPGLARLGSGDEMRLSEIMEQFRTGLPDVAFPEPRSQRPKEPRSDDDATRARRARGKASVPKGASQNGFALWLKGRMGSPK